MRTLVLLMFCGAVTAGREDDLEVARAIRSFNFLLTSRQPGPPSTIGGVRTLIVRHLKKCSPKVAKSIRFQLDRGYKKKYKRDDDFLRHVSRMLAAGGKQGIAKLFLRYKASTKRDGVRVGIAEALGECEDSDALPTLLKIIHDKAPEVAAAAVTSCAVYAKVKPKKRKDAVRKLIDRYMKVSDGAAGKRPESRAMRMYKAVDAAMRESLKAFSGGESLDSALAWDAWWRDNATKPWPE